jgi:hypothetical protein
VGLSFAVPPVKLVDDALEGARKENPAAVAIEMKPDFSCRPVKKDVLDPFRQLQKGMLMSNP